MGNKKADASPTDETQVDGAPVADEQGSAPAVPELPDTDAPTPPDAPPEPPAAPPEPPEAPKKKTGVKNIVVNKDRAGMTVYGVTGKPIVFNADGEAEVSDEEYEHLKNVAGYEVKQ